MPYDESSFLDGLAAGLTATYAQSTGALRRQLATGADRFGASYHLDIPEGSFDTFVFKIIFNSRKAHTVEYEYGPVGTEYQREFLRIQGADELRTLYRVVQIPDAVPMTQFHCDAYFYEPESDLTAFDAYFMAFPYRVGTRDFLYPGSPELVRNWMTRTFRGFDL